ncbi:MAG: aldo/keto reductase [Chitinophagaceae bacterium]|nr:aldo/keto reductase [Chitinophagaceae bacterium]
MKPIQIPGPIAGCMRWGSWGARFSRSEYKNMIDACLDAGITSFDHADIYGDYTTEEEFGEAIRSAPFDRSKMQLISKCGIRMITPNRPEHQIKSYDTSAQHIVESVERSLKNLATDYLDLLLIHRPDPLLQPDEVAAAVIRLQDAGKIRAFGVSNFLPHQMEMLSPNIAISFNQIECSLFARSSLTDGTLHYCLQHHITPMAWAPLGGGMLDEESHPHARSILQCCRQLAEKYETGINQILLAWLLRHPSGIVPVLGTTRIERLIQAKEAESIVLEREDWFRLLQAAEGEEVA